MTIENNDTTTSIDTSFDEDIDLDDFSSQFFSGGDKPQEEDVVSEEVSEDDTSDDYEAPSEDDEQDADGQTDEVLDEDEDDLNPEDFEINDETPEQDAEKEKPKSRAQERIEELNSKWREEQRRNAEMNERLTRVLEQLAKQQYPDEPQVAPQAAVEPTPYDKNVDGTDKYPNGEYDPSFIRDLTRYTVAEEHRVYQEQQVQSLQEAKARIEEKELQAARETAYAEWGARLAKATEEKYHDFAEKNEQLTRSFENLDPAHGDYLALTIMNMDRGEDVLYHIASNPAEAEAIAKMSASQATLALGRIEARFLVEEEAPAQVVEKPKLRISKAPEPPASLNKGATPATSFDPATDDLDAFERQFFSRKRR